VDLESGPGVVRWQELSGWHGGSGEVAGSNWTG
jgi:hypothetical protein